MTASIEEKKRFGYGMPKFSLWIFSILVLTVFAGVIVDQLWWRPRNFAQQELIRYRAAKALVNDSVALAYLDLFDEETWKKTPTMEASDANALTNACKAAEKAAVSDSFGYVLTEQIWAETGARHDDLLISHRRDPRFQKVKALAQAGDPFFMALTGHLYELGVGTQNSQTAAVYWYRKAAESGDAGAAYFLGRLSVKMAHTATVLGAKSADSDYIEAGQWFEKSADLGNGYAAFCLGQLYIDGHLGDKDIKQAVNWYRKGADLKSDVSEETLGDLYFDGREVDTNMVEAAKWYAMAAEQKSRWGQFRLGCMYNYGLGVDQDYGKAFHWYHEASSHVPDTVVFAAERNLGYLLYNGQGADRDFAQAFNYFSLSVAKAEDANSEYMLGIMYELGQGIPENRDKALECYRKAATQGDARARSRLVNLLYPVSKL